ncbi:hypothetical protein [Chitinophaga cymbidii]|nr:hypothetical protein [Chitinophaga cymbidii]
MFRFVASLGIMNDHGRQGNASTGFPNNRFGFPEQLRNIHPAV